MSKEIIRETIFSETILLSQPFKLGEFAGRHFYHSLFGFGTVQANAIPPLGMRADTSPALEIKWDEEGTFNGANTASYYEEDTLELLNQRVLDDKKVREEVNQDAFYMVEEDPFGGYDRAMQDIRTTFINPDTDI